MTKTPLLILGDSPTAPTGLGRIARELALRICENMSDVFRVGTFGVGGTNSRHLPFMNYTATSSANYVLTELPRVWNDFAGDQDGVVLSIWNASWLGWLANPGSLPDSELKTFLKSNPFQRWAYVPVDGEGPDGKLPESIGKILASFDRVLAYTKYGAEVIDRTVWSFPNHRQTRPCEFLPHGLDVSVFYPRDKKEARRTFLQRVGVNPEMEMSPDIFLVGVVATNSARKDWYLAFETCSELLKKGVNVGLWCHTDGLKKNWDLVGLAKQFGMDGRFIPSTVNLSDEDMAWCYSACDVTLGIGSGEGWGYPLAESLACGVAVVHGDYAGGKEVVGSHKQLLVHPVGFKGDGIFGIKRPVFDAADWAEKCLTVKQYWKSNFSNLPAYIDWENAWPRWEQWLRKVVE